MIGRRADDAQSFNEAWSGRAPRDEQIAELVRFAETLCEAAVAEPTPEFRLSLRSALMTEAQTALLPVKSTPRTIAAATTQRPVRRRIAGLTAAALASAGVVGLVSTSASAVPGEMLYSVKRSVESVQLALHQDDGSRGAFMLAQASERLAEARQLSDNPSSRTDSLIASTLDDFSSQAETGSNSLFDEFDSNGKTKSIQKVNDFAAAAATELATLSTLVPESAEDSFASAAKTVSDLAVQASTLCSTCASADAQSLVNAVTALTQSASADDLREASTAKKSDSKSTTTPSTSGSTGSTPAPVLPTPTVTVPPISLAPVTDPLIDGLLGDEGLVPGLLNGLLGNN
ncbi:hypothetical protein J2X11_002748 [Aeromicrobium panaciterrae]|uniref:DUF5667 domain-containing protein n=1 Tax=Aeromicrobium panaciterrae TaxID=363861 RepID=A0ABU1URV7_9ACTN|nr:DUF5667 domain-containing protein [Aeromicrobium panaciterrae]MDR7087909.1 hypothetical protein [Aeromicrobium panaciterrae]